MKKLIERLKRWLFPSPAYKKRQQIARQRAADEKFLKQHDIRIRNADSLTQPKRCNRV